MKNLDVKARNYTETTPRDYFTTQGFTADPQVTQTVVDRGGARRMHIGRGRGPLCHLELKLYHTWTLEWSSGYLPAPHTCSFTCHWECIWKVLPSHDYQLWSTAVVYKLSRSEGQETDSARQPEVTELLVAFLVLQTHSCNHCQCKLCFPWDRTHLPMSYAHCTGACWYIIFSPSWIMHKLIAITSGWCHFEAVKVKPTKS